MTYNEAAKQLALILRAENDALAAGDFAAATSLLPRKETAAADLREATAASTPDPNLATTLTALMHENGTRLEMAMRVQERIMEMIAQAARKAAPPPAYYNAPGRPRSSPRSPIGALALTFRA